MVLLGVEREDTREDLTYITDKLLNLRIFADDNDKFNLSIQDVKGELLVVSQFTLFGDCRKGRRPSFSDAAPPDIGVRLFDEAVATLRASGLTVATGSFGAKMQVSLVNDGPVTLLLDSRKRI
jgi:D-tyrosyl-tRNA(Tyr) deacylase